MYYLFLLCKYVLLLMSPFDDYIMITGAPMIGVTALRGMMPLSPGRTHIMLHRSDMAAPERIVPGMR